MSLYKTRAADPGNDSWVVTDRITPARPPGTVLIGTAGWLLAALAAGLFAVSFAGQYLYIYGARHQQAASVIEAGMLDIGMIIFSLLALGLARAGKPARTERALIVGCALGSAGMNYLAADLASPRSVIAFTAAPLFLAVVVDRVIAVIRRHVLGDDAGSPWTPVGRAGAATARAGGKTALYGLRLALAPPSTGRGLRQALLNATPLPAAEPAAALPPPPADSQPRSDDTPREGTKKARLIKAYHAHPGYGISQLAAEVDTTPQTARNYLRAAKLNGRAP